MWCGGARMGGGAALSFAPLGCGAMAARPRCKEDSQFGGVLLQHVRTPNFINYGDKMDKEKLSVSRLLKMKDLIQALHKLWPNLTFTNVATERALKLVHQHFGGDPDWMSLRDDGQAADWRRACAARLRTMLRHVGSGVRNL